MTNRIFKQIFMGLIVVVALSCSTNQNHAIKIKAEQPILPVLTGKDKNKVLEIELNVPKTPKDLNAKEFVFSLEGTTDIRDLAMATLFYGTEDDFENASVVGKTTDLAPRFSVNANQSLSQGVQYFWLSVSLNESPDLTGKIGVKLTNVTLSDGSQLGVGMEVAPRPQRLGIALRQKGQDGIDTYRIPGIATTNKGTLILSTCKAGELAVIISLSVSGCPTISYKVSK